MIEINKNMKVKVEVALSKLIEQADQVNNYKDVMYILRKKLGELQEERLEQ